MPKPTMVNEVTGPWFIAHRPHVLVMDRSQPLPGTTRQDRIVLEVLRAFGELTYTCLEKATGFPYKSLRNVVSRLNRAGLIIKRIRGFGLETVLAASFRSRVVKGLPGRPLQGPAPVSHDVLVADAILTRLHIPTGSMVITERDLLDGIRPTAQVAARTLRANLDDGGHVWPTAMVYRVDPDDSRNVSFLTAWLYLDAIDNQAPAKAKALVDQLDCGLVLVSPDADVLLHEDWLLGQPAGRVQAVQHTHASTY